MRACHPAGRSRCLQNLDAFQTHFVLKRWLKANPERDHQLKHVTPKGQMTLTAEDVQAIAAGYGQERLALLRCLQLILLTGAGWSAPASRWPGLAAHSGLEPHAGPGRSSCWPPPGAAAPC